MRALLRLAIALFVASVGLWAAIPATDTFTRADSVNDLGPNWTAQDVGHPLGILGQRVYATTFTSWSTSFWSADTFSANQASEWRVIDDGFAGILVTVRASGTTEATQQFYGIAADQSGGSIVLVTGGAMSVIAPFVAVFNGDLVRLEVCGSTVTGKVNGATQGAVTDATLVSGQPGGGMFDLNTLIDDWTGDNVTCGGPPPSTKRLLLMGVSEHP